MTLVQLGSEEPSQEEGEGSEEDEGSGECLVSPQSGKQDVGVVSAEGLKIAGMLINGPHDVPIHMCTCKDAHTPQHTPHTPQHTHHSTHTTAHTPQHIPSTHTTAHTPQHIPSTHTTAHTHHHSTHTTCTHSIPHM